VNTPDAYDCGNMYKYKHAKAALVTLQDSVFWSRMAWTHMKTPRSLQFSSHKSGPSMRKSSEMMDSNRFAPPGISLNMPKELLKHKHHIIIFTLLLRFLSNS
jgi:hypothetical protein